MGLAGWYHHAGLADFQSISFSILDRIPERHLNCYRGLVMDGTQITPNIVRASFDATSVQGQNARNALSYVPGC